jgi:ribose 5-phosphate isomerase A
VVELVSFERRFSQKQPRRALLRPLRSSKAHFQTHTHSFVVVADYRKNVECLGTNVRRTFVAFPSLSLYNAVIKFTSGVPIEVVPFAYAQVLQTLHKTGSPNAILRMAIKKGTYNVTFNAFNAAHMIDPNFPNFP